MNIVPIHNHTQYSALDGLATTVEIADRCEELGIEAVGCTDHDIVAGHVDFYNTMTERGIKPLLGIETYQARTYKGETHGKLKDKTTGEKIDNFHLILLAQNNEGLKNLWRLNTEAHRDGFYHNGRVDFELLEKYNEGLICTSACVLGLLSQAVKGNSSLESPEFYLESYRQIFGDRFYIELSTYDTPWQREVNEGLCSLADTFGVPLVYANDAHYAHPGQYNLHESILCLQYKQKLSQLEEPHHEPCLYIMDETEVRESLSDLSSGEWHEAIDNTVEIAKSCNVTLPERRFRVPIFISESYPSNGDMLLDLVRQGYQKKIVAYDKDKEAYWERLSKEMTVIYNANLVDYFLIVHDYVHEAKKQGIFVGPGRGSIGGSLVAFLIGITEVDPIRYGLIFERFYNAGRELSLPDIDIDFSKSGRDQIVEYVANKYGKDRVANLCTLGEFKGQGAIRDMARVLEIPYGDTEKISKIIETTTDAGLYQEDWAGIEKASHGQLDPYKEKYPSLFDYASQMFGRIRQTGMHASGVIIGDEPLDEVFPLKWNANKKRMVTQWDMDVAEDFGYMKSDFLGLVNLDILDETNKILIEEGKTPINFEALQYQEHEDIFSLFQDGLTVGLFQVEDSGMAKSIAKSVKPRDVLDLAAVVALNRPGPLRGQYADGKTGLQVYMEGRLSGKVYQIHPIYDKVTEETFGVFVYQEQIINYFVELGYSLQEADEIRAIVGKKKTALMDVEYPRYIERASAYMDVEIAAQIWDRIVDFAKYGFNKSHAVEYGIVLLYGCFAKYHYPAQFLTAAIRCVTRFGDKDKAVKYVNEAMRMEIGIAGPDINKSKAETFYNEEENTIYLGFTSITKAARGSSKWIEQHAPYESFEDFREKVADPDNRIWFKNTSKVPVNEDLIDNLVDVGAFDSLEPRDISDEDRITFEEELLKVAISDKSAKILTEHSRKIERLCVSYDVVDQNGEYRVAGIVKSLRKTKTSKGMDMMFVKIAQGADELDFAVWKNEMDRLEVIWQNRAAGIFHIKHTERGNSLIGAECLV